MGNSDLEGQNSPSNAPLPSASDAEFLQRLLDHQGQLRAYAGRFVVPGVVDASDIVQVTLLRAWRARERLEPNDEDGFRKWLFTIARNVGLNVRRDQKRRLVTTSIDASDGSKPNRAQNLPADGDSPSRIMMKQESREALTNWFSRQDSVTGRIFELRYFEGKEWGEIGDLLHMDGDTARMRMRRAIATMPPMLAEEASDGS